MPTYVRPARVIVEESGGGLAAAVAVIAVAAVISSAAVIIADVLTAILITMTALALAGVGVLAIVLRRHGLRAPMPPEPARASVRPPAGRAATALSGPPLAIEAPRPPLHRGASEWTFHSRVKGPSARLAFRDPGQPRRTWSARLATAGRALPALPRRRRGPARSAPVPR